MRILVIAGVMASVVALASPADAKCFGIREVVVQGSGLARPLVLGTDEWGVPRNKRSPQAHAIEDVFTEVPSSVEARFVGPRFRLSHVLEVIDFETGGTRLERIQQDLYSYATLEGGQRGAVTFTPAQSWRSCTGDHEEIGARWGRFPSELVWMLRRSGLPPPAAVPPPDRGSRPAVAVGAGVAVALVGLATIRSRGRAARAPRSR